MEKHGIVYIWRDRKHKRYYIGCHWGHINDGYICSSPWMKQAFKHRPYDFKRRILCLIYTNRQDMFDEEARWQSYISDEELRTKYYNIRRHGDRHWSTDHNKALSVKQKLAAADNTRGLREHAKSRVGMPLQDETRQKISKSLKGRPINYVRSEETRQLISENSSRLQHEKRVGMHGKTHNAETKHLMSKNNAMNDLINRKKISEANKGLQGLRLNGIKKMAKPNTQKWNDLINQGYVPINGAI